MRAREPDAEGHVAFDGVTVGYEVYGEGSPTVVLLPTWTIVHSRIWKAQIPYLARHHRVVAFDGPGNGRTDRTVDPAAYRDDAVAGATVAVMDATATRAAVLVSLSKGANWSLKVAADHPGRVLGQVFISPTVTLAPPADERAQIAETFFDEVVDPEGWQKYNAHHWRHHYGDFVDFFFSECLPEAHSTKQREDAAGWAHETSPDVLLADAMAGWSGPNTVLAWCGRADGPVLVIHGDDDHVSPLSCGQALAAATRGDLIVLNGSGHLPLVREPVRINKILHEFAERCVP